MERNTLISFVTPLGFMLGTLADRRQRSRPSARATRRARLHVVDIDPLRVSGSAATRRPRPGCESRIRSVRTPGSMSRQGQHAGAGSIRVQVANHAARRLFAEPRTQVLRALAFGHERSAQALRDLHPIVPPISVRPACWNSGAYE